MKIFDCFIYNGEDLVLDIRLNELQNIVNKFIIVESRFNHQGKKKKLKFDFKKFSKFKEKINYIVIDRFPKNLSNWERENFQRNYITNGLDLADDNDYIMISDVDEIPSSKKITKIKNHKFSVFKQKMYYYKFNLLNKTDPNWYGTRVCKKKFLKSPQWLRNQKVKNYPIWKFYKIKWNIIDKGGWHFSFLMNTREIKNKIASYAHAEFNNKKFNNSNNIQNSISKQIDIFDRNIKYEKVKFNTSFPKYIADNKKIFKKWILI